MVAVEHIGGIHIAHMVTSTVCLRRLYCLGKQFIGGDGCKGTAQVELAGKIGIGASALGDHQIIEVNMLLDGAGKTHTNNIFHPVAVKQLMGVDSHGRHAHTRGHNGHLYALISAGIALDTTDVIDQNRVFQKVFCDKFRAQRVTGHQNRLAKITRLCADMRGRCS